MKILYLAHRIPYPPNKGDKIRSFNEIRYLSSSHEIHLACLADNPDDLVHESELRQYCKKTSVFLLNRTWAKAKTLFSPFLGSPLSTKYFYCPPVQQTLDRWLSEEQYDGIICFSSPMAEYVFRASSLKDRFSGLNPSNPANPSNPITSFPPPAKRYSPRLIMDFCDVDSDKWLQYSKISPFPSSRLYRLEQRCLLEYEKRINRRFDHSIFVSQHEADLFRGLYPGAQNVHVIPNGVDFGFFSPHNPSLKPCGSSPAGRGMRDAPSASSLPPPTLVFTGAMDYYPNVDGVRWFHDKVLPAIGRHAPALRFLIVGSNPHSKIRALADRDRVTVTGFVEDIRPYYQSADICVVPLRLARGVQNKVLEAMAMAKPVVSTTKAIEGIQAVNREHVLVEDTVEGFVNAISWLLENPQEGMNLGQRARRFVMERYDWSKHMKKFEMLL